MRIAYISSTSYADTDFPLIREYQRLGYEVYYFLTVPCFQLRSTLIDIKKQDPQAGLFPASFYQELLIYKDYIDLSHVIVINRPEKSALAWSTLSLSVKIDKKLKEINPDVVHILGPLDVNNCILYKWRRKMVMTVHDPFAHSGEKSFRRTFFRKLAFLLIKKYVLLNETQKMDFMSQYKKKENQILVNGIGCFDYLSIFTKDIVEQEKQNVLFFGRISPYKGIEYLCEAMLHVRKKVPDATLTIAGSGQFNFDMSNYMKEKWVKVRNHYIGMSELTELLQQCTICVCPYIDATQSGVITTAYSMNKIVVASNVGGLKEMVIDNKTGILVPPRNIEALADAIILLLQNKRKREKMESLIKSNFFSDDRSWKNIAGKYIEFYNN